ncbi:cytochrome P450 [Diaporthe sp. PMI_573]|nr:cytochrome P450 [Diaporthaceae sp. PMI_573]
MPAPIPQHLIEPIALGLLGIIVHVGLFIRGEWHLQAPTIAVSDLVVFLVLFTFKCQHEPSGIRQSLPDMGIDTAAYLSCLLGSMSIYRLFFHSLRAFPGPRLAALTKLWHVWKCRGSKGHHVLEDWHRKYGSIVRTGPNELTLFHPAAFEALDGPRSRNTRSDWYDLLHPRISSIFTRDQGMHKDRRKLWEKIMIASSVAQYYESILVKVRVLEEIISQSNREPLLVNDLIYYFAFDSMGAFGFGMDFGLMRDRKPIDGFRYMRSALGLLGPFTPAIWIARLGFAFIPGLWKVKHWFKMLKFSDNCMNTYIQAYIASAFVEEYKRSGAGKVSDRLLSGDGANLLVAASDSTAPSIIFLLYFLAKYPEHVAKIREELKGIDHEDTRALSALPHLTGTINEALRLLPAIPTAVSRNTPPEGLMFDSVFIPGGVKICAPRYSIGRLEEAFQNPHDFIPERWHNKPELVKAPRAFAPFGMGRTLCVGKNLAMAQMRLVAASILTKHDIDFAPGEENGKAVERDLKDQLTANPGKLRLVFEKRGS